MTLASVAASPINVYRGRSKMRSTLIDENPCACAASITVRVSCFD